MKDEIPTNKNLARMNVHNNITFGSRFKSKKDTFLSSDTI